MEDPDSGALDSDAALLRRLVGLAKSLIDEQDPAYSLQPLLRAVVDLTAAAAASLCVLDDGQPMILANTSPRLARLEQVDLTDPEGGPCKECLRLAEAVTVPDLAADVRWPTFTRVARTFGIREVHVLPLTGRGELVGALNVFGTDQSLSRRDHQVADLMGDLATVALLRRETSARQETEVEQLRLALHSRVAIEQAKGVLSEKAGLDMAAAFEAMRRYSRANRRPLHEVAQAVADRSLAADEVLASVQPPDAGSRPRRRR